MELTDILSLILAIITGLSTAIPLAIQLVKYINLAIKERNFGKIMKIALELMAEAEENYATGAERKEYVMDSIRKLSDSLDYAVDFDAVSDMIDAIIESSKKINVKQ